MAEVSYRPIERLDVFLIFESVSDDVWDLVSQWSTFTQDTVGKQLVRAVDSVGANLVEGDGRGSDPDSIRFFRYSRSSAREARLWINRSITRKLIDVQKGTDMIARLEKGTLLLNNLIKYRREASEVKRVKEPLSAYKGSPLESTD